MEFYKLTINSFIFLFSKNSCILVIFENMNKYFKTQFYKMVKVCESKYPTTETKYNHLFSEYPFELDHFQKYAIQAIEENHHVLITAHTG